MLRVFNHYSGKLGNALLLVWGYLYEIGLTIIYTVTEKYLPQNYHILPFDAFFSLPSSSSTPFVCGGCWMLQIYGQSEMGEGDAKKYSRTDEGNHEEH